ncbi:aspartyl aminopeptidase [Hydra vulgaris]|uniref:Aspartyl aminopeptidase n=1 Tax=Hydra vulgaris TaxID=6087 RepID=T2M3F8_HYDVU|nr:aspartyl aminopeptidase [Hydra vulgaris]
MQKQDKVLASAKALIDFINASPSPYHVIQNCREKLLSVGFSEIFEKDKWKINKGGKYFVTRNQSSVIAFAVGKQFNGGNGFSIIGAHTDSPCFVVKPNSKKEESGYLSVGVQCYGGGIWSTWFDRDLTLAGRVLVKDSGKAASINHQLVHIKKPILRIPHLCIHLQREMNENFSINKEVHLLPIIATKAFDDQLNKSVGVGVKHHSVLVNLLCNELQCQQENLLDFDLCLTDTQPATVGGAYDEFIFAPRLDNLFNCYSSLQALIDSIEDDLQEETNIRMIALYDNEEVGSESAQGACSMLTENIMRRVCIDLNSSFEQSVANSFLISADQAHAVHPNYADKHEKNHRPAFHGGPVVKFNANQRYATTAVTASLLRVIANSCNVPLQDVVVRNDSTCGTTIGPIISARIGIRTIDIGGPQLAMHSIRETCCTSSVDQCLVLFKEFFQKFPIIDKSFNI